MTAQHRRPSRHWQLLAAGLAAVTIGALATVTPGASADAAAPHAGTRAQVPWSRVGTGWTLATWAKSPEKDRPTLFLLAPDGHRYKITTIDPRSDIQDWSPDGRRVLVGDYDNHRREIDLHTGRSHVVRLPKGSYVDSYTRPNGRAILVDVNDRLERFDLRGHHQKTYPAKVRGAGWLNAGGIETADGTQLVVAAGKGMVVLRNNGSVVRRLMPKSHECHPVSFESVTSLQASCSGRIWSVPLSGAKAHPVTKGPNKSNEFGYEQAWRYSSGMMGLAGVGCGPLRLVRFDKAGNGHDVKVKLPSGKAARVVVAGHHGDEVELLARPGGPSCMGGKDSLITYNAATHRRKALLGPGVNGGTVLSIQDYPIR